MASSKREKELARQRAVRQAARNAAVTKRKKQRNAVVASIVAVLLIGVAGIATALALGSNGDSETVADPAPSSSSAPSTAPTGGASTAPSTAPSSEASAAPATDPGCVYTKTEDKPARQVELPPTEGIETQKTYDVTLDTDQGEIVFEMDSAKAPCTANSLRSLAHFAYFDDTPCHRLTTEGIEVLQCGDPTGTGSGGPGYQFAEENLEGASYPRGTVAMARTMEEGTNGSQFFLVYGDSQLPPNYTPFGTITKGLDVLDKVAKAGTDNSNGNGDGKPKLPVQIETLRATEAK